MGLRDGMKVERSRDAFELTAWRAAVYVVDIEALREQVDPVTKTVLWADVIKHVRLYQSQIVLRDGTIPEDSVINDLGIQIGQGLAKNARSDAVSTPGESS